MYETALGPGKRKCCNALTQDMKWYTGNIGKTCTINSKATTEKQKVLLINQQKR